MPDIAPTDQADRTVEPLHHERGRRRAPVRARPDARRAVPRALRAVRDRRSPTRFAPKIRGNPAARVFQGDMEQFGDAKEFPYAATSYRLTEHFHFWTKHVTCECGRCSRSSSSRSRRSWPRRRASSRGGWVQVWSKRGSVKAQGRGDQADQAADAATASPCHIVGIPLHWGFTGAAQKGFGPNSLTPYVGDANIETPEYKAFLRRTSSPSPGRWLKGGIEHVSADSQSDPTARPRRRSASRT